MLWVPPEGPDTVLPLLDSYTELLEMTDSAAGAKCRHFRRYGATGKPRDQVHLAVTGTECFTVETTIAMVFPALIATPIPTESRSSRVADPALPVTCRSELPVDGVRNSKRNSVLWRIPMIWCCWVNVASLMTVEKVN